MALTALIPALTGLLGVGADYMAKEQQADANVDTIRSMATSLEFSQANKAEQIQDLDRIVGDKLSASGLEALKAEARLKAASAETGATGTSIQDAIATADVNRLHRDAVILRTHDVQKASKFKELAADRLNFDNQMNSILSGIPSTTQSVLSSANAFLGGASSGLNFMSQSQKEDMFNINTTGEKTNG